MSFQLSTDHREWARRHSKKYKLAESYLLSLITQQAGVCAFSGVVMFFDRLSGTPVTGGVGQHPLYATLEHCSPGCDDEGHEIVCSDLNDVKAHLPSDCFAELRLTGSWKARMARWKNVAATSPADRAALKAILK
jgi:hypothetical protein